MNMSRKIALITGGTRGIGKAIAERFVEDGFLVVFTGRSEESVSRAQEILSTNAIGIACDVTDPSAVKSLFDQIVKDHGTLHVLVNNAGITRDNLLLRMKADQWDEVLNTNLRGAFLCCQAAVRPMMKNENGGRIINISSVVGLMGNGGQANYSAAKAGLIGLTKSVAKEFGSRNILVNAIAPGFIQTDMTAGLSEEMRKRLLDTIPLGRFGSPEDVAGVCSFLAGPNAGYITGQVLTVDGGMVM